MPRPFHRFRPSLLCLEDRLAPAVFHVALTGDDANTGGTADPFRTVQRAIDAAAAVVGPHEIRVASGTYNTATVDLNLTINDPDLIGLRLLGGFDATFGSQTPGSTVYITQQAGNIDFADVDIFNSGVTVRGFTFVFDGQLGNGGTRAGGGLFVRDTNTVIDQNTFEGSARIAGSGARPQSISSVLGANLTGLQITGNTIISNGGTPGFAQAGGGIYLNPDAAGRTMPVVIRGNTITGINLGSAITVDSLSNVTIDENSLVRTGTADIGLPLVDVRQTRLATGPAPAPQTNIVITDNDIFGNRTDRGAGISLIGRTPTGAEPVLQSIDAVTITDNRISGSAAGILVGANATVANTFIARNDLSGNATVAATATTGTLNLSGNWFGTADPDTIETLDYDLPGFAGPVTIGAFLSSGADADTSAPGLQLPAATEMLVPEKGLTADRIVVDGVIQHGIDAALAGMTVRVAADTYAENLVIRKSVDLLGAQAGNHADPRFAAFVGGKADPSVETVLTTPVNNPSGGNPNANDIIRALADDITIDGFTIDGNNPDLPASSVVLGGVDVHARRGITNIGTDDGFNPVSRLVVRNNVIQNVAERGVSINNGDTVGTGSLVARNRIRNFGDPNVGGLGVFFRQNAYGDVIDNTIEATQQNATGIFLSTMFTANVGNAPIIVRDNRISVGQDGAGIFSNNHFGDASPIQITNNAVNAIAGVSATSDLTWGITLWGTQTTVAITLSDNTVGGPGRFSRGIYVWNAPTSNPVTITGGSVTSSETGLVLDAIDPFFGNTSGTNTVNVDGLAISGATTGVRVDNNPLATPPGSGSNIPNANLVLNYTGGSVSATSAGFLVSDLTADAFTATANLSGVSVSGATTGVNIVGGQAVGTLFRSTVSSNTTGVSVQSGTLGTGAIPTAENFITNNTNCIVLAGSANTAGIVGNDLSGNTQFAIDNGTGTLIDGSLNWFGTNTPAGVAGELFGPVDYTAWLDVGTDTVPATPGFQGDRRVLHVDDDSPLLGGIGRIAYAISVVTGATPTVIAHAGTYAEAVTVNVDNLTLRGATGNAAEVVIDPPAGDGVTVTTNGVTLRDFRVTGSVNALIANSVNTLNLVNLRSDGNTSGGTLTDVDRLTVTFRPSADAVTADGDSFAATGLQEIGFTGTDDLSLDGGLGDDSFTITPPASGGVDIAIDGGDPNPPASPGDTLDLVLTGTTDATATTAGPTGFAGTFSFSNRQAVTFSRIEALADGTMTTVTLTPSSAEPGTPIAFTATVTANDSAAPTPTGEVRFVVVNTATGATVIDRVIVLPPSGVVTFTEASLPAGNYVVTATYGNGNLPGSVGTGSLALAAPSTSTPGGAVPPATYTLHGGAPLGAAVTGGAVSRVFNPFVGFTGTLVMATGDFDGDGVQDLAFAVASGGPAAVFAFSGSNGALIYAGLAFGTFDGGLTLAAGDYDGDGADDLIVGTRTAVSHVKAISATKATELASFFAFNTGVGVSVAAADLDGDGRADIITGARGGLGGHIKAFAASDGRLLMSKLAFAGFTGGIDISAGDIDGDGDADILAGTATGGGHVKAFDADGTELLSLFAFPGFTGGVRVGFGDADGDGDGDLLVGAASGLPVLRVIDGRSRSVLFDVLAAPVGFTGGIEPA